MAGPDKTLVEAIGDALAGFEEASWDVSSGDAIHVHVQDAPDGPSFGAGLAAGYEEGRRHGRR